MALENFIPVQNYKANEFIEMLKRLCPRGSIWNFTIGNSGDTSYSLVGILFSIVAEELSKISEEITRLFKESVPGLSTDSYLLSDWERIAGLPDNCSPLADTEAQRQAVVHAKIYTQYTGLTPDFFINYAAGLNVTITVVDGGAINVFRTGHKKDGTIQRVTRTPELGIDGARLNSQSDFNTFTVNVILDPDGNQDILECVFNKLKPAHTGMIFNKI